MLPPPPTATSTGFGLLSASLPRSCPIIARQYCRFSFARQRRDGVVPSEGKIATATLTVLGLGNHSLTRTLRRKPMDFPSARPTSVLWHAPLGFWQLYLSYAAQGVFHNRVVLLVLAGVLCVARSATCSAQELASRMDQVIQDYSQRKT